MFFTKTVKSFLESRNIELPFGTPEDDTRLETICGLGNRKNVAFNEVLKSEGVEAYPSTVKLLETLKKDGIRIGVASSSKNCEAVLNAAGLMHFVETRVDGVVSANMGLKGKPQPDIFLTAAANLGVAGTEIDKTLPFTSGNATVWVRLENATTGCFKVTTLNLIVNPLPQVVPHAPVSSCSNGATGVAEFDLSAYSSDISGGIGGVVAFLCTPEAGWMNGQRIELSGGMMV